MVVWSQVAGVGPPFWSHKVAVKRRNIHFFQGPWANGAGMDGGGAGSDVKIAHAQF